MLGSRRPLCWAERGGVGSCGFSRSPVQGQQPPPWHGASSPCAGRAEALVCCCHSSILVQTRLKGKARGTIRSGKYKGKKMGCGVISSSLITSVPCVLHTSCQREVLRSRWADFFFFFFSLYAQAEQQERKNKGQQIDGGTVIVPNCAVPQVQTQCTWDMIPKKKGQTLSTMVVGVEAGRMAVVPHVDF